MNGELLLISIAGDIDGAARATGRDDSSGGTQGGAVGDAGDPTGPILAAAAAHRAQVIDVRQALTHGELDLRLILQLPAQDDSAPLFKDLMLTAQRLGCRIRFTPMTEADYRGWVDRQSGVRHIVTLLARRLEARQLALVTEVLQAQGMTVASIERLSGLQHLGDTNARTIVELGVLGTPLDRAALRTRLLSAAQAEGIDISIQQDTVFRRHRRLVVFDMDSTLIRGEVIDELAAEAGLGDQVAAITASAMRGEIDFKESFRRRVKLLAGTPASVLEKVAQRVELSDGAADLISTLQRFGFKTAILSGGFQYVGDQLQRRLGIDYVYANHLEIADGVITGNVTGDIVDGARKAELLAEIAAKEGLHLAQVIAVGDGANDLPMLAKAGLGIAFRAKPIVQERAEHTISEMGLDGILYMLGFSERDLQ